MSETPETPLVETLPTPSTTPENQNSSPTDPTKQNTTEPPKEEPKKEDEPKKEEAPAFTAEDITLPEGAEVLPEIQEEFVALMNNLPTDKKELAQKLVDMQAKVNEAAATQWNKMISDWETEISKDPQLGGPNLDANLASAKKLVSGYAEAVTSQLPEAERSAKAQEISQGVFDALTLTGAGSNPSVVRFMVWAAAQLGEGSPLKGTPPVGEKSTADKLFGS